MNVNQFTVDCFNKHQPHFYLLLLESESLNIYEHIDSELIIATTTDFKYQLLKIHNINSVKSKLIFKIELPNNKFGYVSPKSSLLLIPKSIKQVSIDSAATYDNELNKFMKISESNFKNKRDNVMFSKHYTIFNNKIYECLILVDEIFCFLEQDYVNDLHRHETEFNIINDTQIFRDKAMKKPVSLLKDKKVTFKTQYLMPTENKLRFKFSGKNVWINSLDTNLNIKITEEKFSDINNLIIGSILFQYKKKVEDYHNYYSKLLN